MDIIGNIKSIVVGLVVAALTFMVTDSYERVVNYPKIEAKAAAAEASKWQAAQDKARDEADAARKGAQAKIADAEKQIVNSGEADAQRIVQLEQALQNEKGKPRINTCWPALPRGVRAKLDPIGR